MLVTQDKGFLAEAALRRGERREFLGIIYAPQKGMTYSKFISDLEMLTKVLEPREMRNHVEYLPLR